MQFILNGFSQEMEYRIFAFDCVRSDRTRTPYTVRIDLALSRRYGIRLQELPLLCREVLERRDENEETRAFTYTEKDMSLFADSAAAKTKAAHRGKPPRPPATEVFGSAWGATARVPAAGQRDKDKTLTNE